MDFNHFIKIIPKIIQENLLGELSHLKMCPPERHDLMQNIDFETIKPKEAAIMMLLYPKINKTHLALILRTSYNGVHSSQIAFPGGKVEKFDKNFQETALRETHEEIGIIPELINVIRDFTPIYIPPSNFMVYPFLGYSTNELIFNPDPKEVAGIIELPIKDFLDNNNIIVNKMATSYNQDIDVPAFKIQENIVWGATAMMLSELKDVLENVL
jgi:8-oxo-dGTP pyrophosphatase MutT (NUDIX family)